MNLSLPKIARAVGLKGSQGLNSFLKEANWDVEKVREIRLWLTKLLIGEREIILCIDETEDAKKGKAFESCWHFEVFFLIFFILRFFRWNYL